jgi:hypothetical protein
MGTQFAFGNDNERGFYTRAQIEAEIHQRDLSLRKINEERLQLAEGLTKNEFLQRLITRRCRESCLRVDRIRSRKHSGS